MKLFSEQLSMQTHWQGYYLDGVTANKQRVTVVLTPHAVQIAKEDGSTLFWPLSEVRQSQGFYEGEHVRLEKGTDQIEALVVEESGFLAVLGAMASGESGRFGRRTLGLRKGVLLFTAVCLAVAVTAVIYLKLLPAPTSRLAENIPPAWEAKLGETVVDQLTFNMEKCEEPLVTGSINGIVEKLSAALPHHEYKFKVSVVKSDEVNALAAPGGYIIVFTGLLKKTERAEELAGVLAHEMQHVAKKHATKKILDNLSTNMILSLTFGDMNSLGRAAAQGAGTLATLSYSRALEEEADRLGMDLMHAAEIDPSGMTGFFDKLKENRVMDSRLMRYLSTHPRTGDRVTRLKKQADEAARRYPPLLPDVRWSEVVKRCDIDNSPQSPLAKRGG